MRRGSNSIGGLRDSFSSIHFQRSGFRVTPARATASDARRGLAPAADRNKKTGHLQMSRAGPTFLPCPIWHWLTPRQHASFGSRWGTVPQDPTNDEIAFALASVLLPGGGR